MIETMTYGVSVDWSAEHDGFIVREVNPSLYPCDVFGPFETCEQACEAAEQLVEHWHRSASKMVAGMTSQLKQCDENAARLAARYDELLSKRGDR